MYDELNGSMTQLGVTGHVIGYVARVSGNAVVVVVVAVGRVDGGLCVVWLVWLVWLVWCGWCGEVGVVWLVWCGW